MKLIYYQLNKYHPIHGFPLDVVGKFSDGINIFLIILPLQGQILFKCEFDDGDVKKADQAFLATTNNKKIPSDVVCYIEQS